MHTLPRRPLFLCALLWRRGPIENFVAMCAPGTLRHVWAPQGYIVSFKLETDASILRQKAEGSLDK